MKNIILLCILFILTNPTKIYSQVWDQLNLPNRGDVEDIAVSHSNPSLLYIVGDDGTYKSTDGGGSWIKVSNNHGDMVRVSYLDPNYVVTNTEKSTNGGQSWIPSDLHFAIFDFAPSSNTVLYKVYAGQVQISSDFGNSWTTILSNYYSYGQYPRLLVHPMQGNLVFIVTPDTLYKSTNQGGNWIKIKYRDYINTSNIANASCLGFNDPNLILIKQLNSIYKSTNGGTSFTLYPCDLDILHITNIPNQANSLLSIVRNGDGYLIYKSNDLGVSWSPKGLYSVFYHPSRICYGSNNKLYVGYPEAGVFRSINNGDYWKSIGPIHINIENWDDQIIIINDQVYFLDKSPNLYKTSDGGNNWTLMAGNRNYGLQNSIFVEREVGNEIYVPDFNQIHRTLNGGISWEILPITSIYASKVIVSSNNSDVIVSSDHSDLSISTDGGLTWNFIDTPNTEDIKEIYLSYTNSNRIFLRVHSQPNKLYRSNDLGNSWNLCFNESSIEEDYSLTQKRNTSDLYLANGSVYKTSDDGTNWDQVYTGSFGEDIIDIVVDQNNVNNLYAYYYYDSHNRKIFVSSNGGDSWQDASYGLPSSINDVFDLSISNSGKVYILTDNGFWAGYPSINSVDDDNLILEFYLSNNYPNPFNPITMIKYQIPEFNFVTLKVYDVLGTEIATLINEEKSVGTYEVEFDGSNLSSGVYFYRLKAGNFFETKKMILMR